MLENLWDSVIINTDFSEFLVKKLFCQNYPILPKAKFSIKFSSPKESQNLL